MYVSNEGAELYWEEHGSGPPVLMIMGLSFTLEMWFRLLPYIAASHRVILFDNRGMGRSSVPPGPYSIAKMARDAKAVMECAGVERAHVIGASMGGMIAQELALRNPERVSSLVLACTTHSGVFGRWPSFRKAPRLKLWLPTARIEREEALVPMLYADSTPRQLIEEDLRLRAGCAWSAKGFLNQFAAILPWSSYRRLPRIGVPTLVIHGEQDHLIPIQNGKALARRIPHAVFEAVANAGHVLTTDQPEFCGQMAQNFLRQHSNTLVVGSELVG